MCMFLCVSVCGVLQEGMERCAKKLNEIDEVSVHASVYVSVLCVVHMCVLL